MFYYTTTIFIYPQLMYTLIMTTRHPHANFNKNQPNRNYWHNFTTSIMMPLYLGLLHWVLNTTDPNSTILFLSRDGYMLNQLIKHLQKHDPTTSNLIKAKNISIDYLPISRSFIKLTYATTKNDFKLFKEYATLKVVRFNTSTPDVDFKKLFEEYKQQSIKYKKFLEKYNLDKQKLYTFEIGWRGTTVFYFLQLLKSYKFTPDLTPLYYGSLATTPEEIKTKQKTYAIKNNKPEDLFHVTNAYIVLFEFMFSAPHGRFKQLNKDLSPQWHKVPTNFKQIQQTLEKHLLNQVTEYLKKHKDFYTNFNYTPRQVTQPFIDFATQKNFNDLKQFSNIDLEIGTFAELRPIVVQSVTKQEFLALSKKQILKKMDYSLWQNTIFISDVPEQEFYQLLKQKGVYQRFQQGWKPNFIYLIKLLLADPYKIIRAIKQPKDYLQQTITFIKKLFQQA